MIERPASRRLWWAAALVASLAALWALSAPTAPQPGPRVRGVALGLFASTPDYDYTPMVHELRGRGATDVLVVVNWFQADVGDHVIAPRPERSPSEANIGRALTAVREAGMRATLMPVVRLTRREASEWRGRLRPRAGVEAWFDSYQGFLMRMARLASAHGAHRLVVGSELASLTQHEGRWRALIAATRSAFAGKLTYSANWDHFEAVPFWDALDEIGVTGYFTLAGPGEAPDEESLAEAWSAPVSSLRAFGHRHGRPVIITEIGYAPHTSAAHTPWREVFDERPTRDTLALQARLYIAFCDAFAEDAVAGFFFWNWFGHGGPQDPTYTPRGKPAASAMERCLRD